MNVLHLSIPDSKYAEKPKPGRFYLIRFEHEGEMRIAAARIVNGVFHLNQDVYDNKTPARLKLESVLGWLKFSDWRMRGD